MTQKRQDLTGLIVDRWLVKEPIKRPTSKNAYSFCICLDCNKTHTFRDSDLRKGHVARCVCGKETAEDRVIAAIVQAKETAIANCTYQLPVRCDLALAAGLVKTYFYNDRSAVVARVNAFYDAAIEELARISRAPQQLRPQPLKAMPIENESNKVRSLLAHLKLQTFELKRLPRLLNITQAQADALAARLEREGKITIDRSYENHAYLSLTQEKKSA